MHIVKIEIFRLAIPFDSGREIIASESSDIYNAASPELSKMETLLIKLTSNTGMVGWGESFGHLINPITFAALKESVGRFFLKKNIPRTPEEIRDIMNKARYAFHGFGNSGPVMYALSGIDIALWDLLAKQHKLPLHRLLGSNRKQIGVYASLVSYGDKIDQHVKRAYQQGFRKIKLHEIIYEHIRKARKALPCDAELMVDVNCPWTLDEAISHAKELAPLKLSWLEEPLFPPNDVIGLARIRQEKTPIAAGENIDAAQGFEQHFINDAIDIAQPSVSKVGGITAMLDVFNLAKKYNVTVVPHCFYYGAGLFATAHLTSLLSEDIELEVPYIQWQEKLYPEMEVKPTFKIPDIPGLGFSPDPIIFEKYQIAFTCLESKGAN